MEEMESMDVRRVKKSCPCKRRDMGCCCSSPTLELEQKVKEIWNWTEENVQTHSASWQTVTYQRTITGDRNYFGHRVQEYRERKENCNA